MTGFGKRDAKTGRYIGGSSNRTKVFANGDIDERTRQMRIEAKKKVLADHDKLEKAGYIFDKNTPESVWQERGAGDLEEHNSDILSNLIGQEPLWKQANQIEGERFVRRWAEATLKDFGFDVTDKSIEFAIDYFKVPTWMM